jgi:hypothetical protein
LENYKERLRRTVGRKANDVPTGSVRCAMLRRQTAVLKAEIILLERK